MDLKLLNLSFTPWDGVSEGLGWSVWITALVWSTVGRGVGRID